MATSTKSRIVGSVKGKKRSSPRPLKSEAKKKPRPIAGSTSDGESYELGRAILKMAAIEDDPHWHELRTQMLRASLPLFAKEVLGLEIGPHLVEWGDLVEQYNRLAIIAARDHSKSTFFSYAYPIWRAWSEPGCEVYLFSSTLDQAKEFLDIIVYGRDNLRGLVDIPELQHLIPTREELATNRKVRLNRQDIRLRNGSRIRAIGYGKKIRGRHPKYIVCDDVLNDEDMFSETVRRKNIEYFRSAISNMVHPNGQIVCVGTPYHMADLWGQLKKNKAYHFRRYPGLFKDKKTGKERALFPWRWTVKALYAKKIEIGSIAFTREILCVPISDDLSLFPSYLFPPLRDPKLRLRPKLSDIRARGLTTFMGVDIARSATVGADYFVLFVIGADDAGNHYLIDIERHHGFPFKRQLERIEIVAKRYDCQLVFIESNAMQQVWSDEMKRTTDVPVKEFITLASNKYPLDKGIPGLRILLENEKVIIPYDESDEYTIRMVDIWVEEMTSVGFVDGKIQSAAEHDDTCMAFWFACEAKKAGGFRFAIGDDEAEESNDWGEEQQGDEESWEDVLLGKDDEEDGATAY